MTVTATAPAVSAEAQSREELVAAAAALIPVLRSRSDETARLAKLPDATIADLEAAGVFDMTVPRLYGGMQTSLRTFMEVIVQLAKGDGSVAWSANLICGSLWMAAALFPKSVTDTVFANGGNVRVASSLAIRDVRTRPADGGVFIEDGFWRFNSGVDHVSWDIVALPVLNDAGEVVDKLLAILPISDVKVLDDWDPSGLRGSGSTNVAVKDIFVPDERLLAFSACLKGEYGAVHLLEEPLYRIPAPPLMVVVLVFPALGMAKAALEMFLENVSRRGITNSPYKKQNEAVVTHLQVAAASMKIDVAERLLRSWTDELDRNAATGRSMSVTERVTVRRDACYASQMLWKRWRSFQAHPAGHLYPRTTVSTGSGRTSEWRPCMPASIPAWRWNCSAASCAGWSRTY